MILIYKIIPSKACNIIFFEARAVSAFRAFPRGLILNGYGLPQQKRPTSHFPKNAFFPDNEKCQFPGLRVPVAGLTRVDTIQGKKDRDNRQMAFGQACELTGEEYSQPIDLFMFTKSNRRVPYRLDLLMEQVRLIVSSCAYSTDSFLYGSCCFGSFEGEEGRFRLPTSGSNGRLKKVRLEIRGGFVKLLTEK